MLTSITSRFFCFFGSCLLLCVPLFALKAQSPAADSLFLVELPAGYTLPKGLLPEDEVVESALILPDAETLSPLSFDTTAAIPLEDVTFDQAYFNYASEQLIKDRLNCLQTDFPFSYHERVRVFIDYFLLKNRAFTLRIMQRKNLYFPLFERILAEYGLPDQLKYLSIIESGLVPNARSRAGAVGLWQFMPYTGRQYNLHKTYYIDERMDPEKATRAACKYLSYLYDMFGDWELAVAAYNCGPGNVRKALRYAKKPYKYSTKKGSLKKNTCTLLRGKSHFWEIYRRLPRETRSYLPQLVAMVYVLSYAQEHYLIQDAPHYPIPSDEVYVSQSVDFVKLAEELHLCYEDLKLLNPEIRWGIIPAKAKNYAFKIPIARLPQFLNNREEILEKSKYTGRNIYYEGKKVGKSKGKQKYYHTVRRNESLGLIAQKNGVSLSKLRKWNQIYSNLIKPGQKLVIYKGKQNAAAAQTTHRRNGAVPPGKTYIVRQGDSLWVIAQKFRGVTVEKLKKMNKLNSNRLKPGQKLKLS